MRQYSYDDNDSGSLNEYRRSRDVVIVSIT